MSNEGKKRLHNLIVVDESGSMEAIREQALVGMNDTIEAIKKMEKEYKGVDQSVTLLTFDSDHLNFIFDNVKAKDTRLLKWNEYNPGACTPLYDAIGQGIARVNALCAEGDTVLVTIITDGYENASREYNLKMIKNLIEKLKKQGWTFTFIGTDNLEVEVIAKSMGIEDHLSFKQDAEGTEAMFAEERESRRRFCNNLYSGEPTSLGAFFNKNED